MGLLETRLLCQAEAGEVAFLNALPKSIAEVVLQHSEFHRREYSMEYSNALIKKRFPQPVGYNDLDDDYALDTERSQAYILIMLRGHVKDLLSATTMILVFVVLVRKLRKQ